MSFEEWREVELGDVLEIKKEIYKPQYREDLPYIGLEHIGQGDLRIHGTGNAKEVESNKYRFQKGDILFGKLRPYFRKVVIPKMDGVCSTDIWVLRTKSPEMADQVFLYYLMASEPIIEMATSSSTGTRMPRADWNHLSKVRIPLPDLPTQKKIAKLLADLDEKIELNCRINKNLEEMAQAIFKSWFVDFEPFRDGEFVESELGMIPKGWKVKRVDEICTIQGGGTPKTKIEEYWDGNILWATPSDMTSKKSLVIYDTARKITEAGLNNSSTKLLPAGSILLTSRATIGYVAVAMKEMCTNQGFINLICDQSVSNYYMLFFLKSNKDRIIGMANGSTFLEVSKKAFKEMKVLVPPPEVVEEFDRTVSPIIYTIYAREVENEKISELRDILLPKLMSGEIRIPRD